MTEYLLPDVLSVESEFLTTPATSGACGPNALAAAMRWPVQTNTYTTNTVYHSMLGWVLCDTNGVTNTNKLRAAVSKYGWSYQNPASGETPQHFAGRVFKQTNANLPLAGVVLFYTNGQALHDEITGLGMDAVNLQGHFNTLVGYNSGGSSSHTSKPLPEGFWVADGDNLVQNPMVNGVRVHRTLNRQLVYYALTTIQAAQPRDGFTVYAPYSVLARRVCTLAWHLRQIEAIAGVTYDG